MKQGCLVDIRPSDLPSPPQSSLNILNACSQQDYGLNHISQLVAKDAVLTAELLRVVNSAYFGMSGEVRSLDRAITILGQRTLKNLVLCFAMRDVVRQKQLPDFDVQTFWLQSLQRAVCAQQVGEILKIAPEECFVAGLLQDFGLLVLFYLQPNQIAHWQNMCYQSPDERYAAEQEIFQNTHDNVIKVLSHNWLLPEDMTATLAGHHSVTTFGSTEVDKISYILLCSDWITAIFNAQNKTPIIEKCNKLLDGCHIDKPRRQALLSGIADKVKEAAEALGIHIVKPIDYDQVLRDANLELAEANLSYQELTWKLQTVIKERDKYAAELSKELLLAKEVQQSLLPPQHPKDYPIIGLNVPAKELSGDFYDYFLTVDQKIVFSLGDVSGKGINAALLMSKTASLIRCLGKQITDPSKLMAILNTELCETAIRGMFVTLILGVYNPKNDTVQLVNAGNPPALIISRTGKFKTIDAHAPPLGIMSPCDYPKAEFNLNGNGLYLYSDGVTEGYTQDGSVLGLKGLIKILLSNMGMSPGERIYAVVKALENASISVKDDITMLLVENSNER